MGEKKGREILAGMLASPDEFMRASATYALGHVRDEADVPRLVELLEDPSWLVRKNAVRALVKHGGHALPRVTAALNSPDPHVRLGALDIIGQLKNPSVRQGVIALLEDDLGEVRSKAEEVLDLLDGF
jgi:HEAT repeat protein